MPEVYSFVYSQEILYAPAWDGKEPSSRDCSPMALESLCCSCWELHDKLLKDLNLYHSPTSGPIPPLAFPYSYCTHKGSRKASRSSLWVSHVAEWQVILCLLLHESLGLKSIWFWVWWSKDGDLFLPSGNFCGVMRVFPNLGFSYHYRTLMCEGEGRLLAELWTHDYSVSMACVGVCACW